MAPGQGSAGPVVPAQGGVEVLGLGGTGQVDLGTVTSITKLILVSEQDKRGKKHPHYRAFWQGFTIHIITCNRIRYTFSNSCLLLG